MDETDLRRLVANHRGIAERRLRDDAWRILRERGQVAGAIEALDGGYETTQIADLADDYGEIEAELSASEEHQPPGEERTRRRCMAEDRRARALARILVMMAECEELVISFRRDVLGDRLLDHTEVVAWIETQARSGHRVLMEQIELPEGVSGYDPTVDADDGNAYADWLEEIAREARAQHLRPTVAKTSFFEMLAFAGPDQEWVRHIPVNPATDLARLKSVAKLLTTRVHWNEAHAVSFVLAGFEPPVPTVVVTTTRRPLPALDRIAIEVDPRTAAVDVAKIYTSQRAALRRLRDKVMHDKHLALAVFAESTRDSGATWPQLRSRWNEAVESAHPRWGFDEPHLEWRYDDAVMDSPARRFAMDCRNAWTRVTGLRWHRAATDHAENDAGTATDRWKANRR